MKNTKEHFVIINTNDFSINVCHKKAEVALILSLHRNTLTSMPERAIFTKKIGETKHNYLVITITD